MPRWYLGFRCWAKNRQILANQFADQVQQHNLGKYIPVMRVEKGKKRGEFYLFLAIESDTTSKLPDAVQNILPHLSSLGTPLKKSDGFVFESFSLDQIRTMVGVEHTVRDYALLIPYSAQKTPELSDPFAFQEQGVLSCEDDPEEIFLRSRRYERLLIWISATGSGSWQSFQNACYALGLKGRYDSPAQVLRRMRLLGHMETAADLSRWSVTPTMLVQSGAEESFFLCGQRDRVMLQTLHNYAPLAEVMQPYGEAPAFTRFCECNRKLPEVLQQHHALRFVGNAALRLAQAIPSVAAWKRMLEKLSFFSPYQYRVKRFNRVGFEEADFNDKISGLYEFWPLKEHFSASDRPAYTLFYDVDSASFLRGDWYGLRFLAMQSNDMPCTVAYEASSQTLAVPQEVRWPELYERILTLASGMLPSHKDGWLLYRSITSEILAELTPKLNLEY